MALESGDGDGVSSVGIEAYEFYFVAGHALNLNIDEAGFGGSLSAETPKGGGHFCYQDVFDPVDGFPSFKVNSDEFLKFGEFFAGQDKVTGVSAVGDGVEDGTAFAFEGFGAGGFQCVEA